MQKERDEEVDAHESRHIGFAAAMRIATAAGEGSGQQAARRAAVALAGRLGIADASLRGGDGGWKFNPPEQRLHQALQGGDAG